MGWGGCWPGPVTPCVCFGCDGLHVPEGLQAALQFCVAMTEPGTGHRPSETKLLVCMHRSEQLVYMNARIYIYMCVCVCVWSG